MTIQELKEKIEKAKKNTLIRPEDKKKLIAKWQAEIDKLEPPKPKATKTTHPDCEELEKQFLARRAAAKKSAKKSEATKSKAAVEKTAESIKHKFEKGELTKKQIRVLIKELTDQIKELKALLSVKKMREGGNIVSKTWKVSYDKKVGGKGSVIVKGIDKQNALQNAKQHVFTGKNFEVVKELDNSEYIKPRQQGFAGSGRAN